MIGSITYKTILSITVLTASTFFCHLALAGGSSTGGGYEYRDTALPHLKNLQSRLVEALSFTTDEELNRIASEFTTKPMNVKTLSDVIKTMKYAPTENRTREYNGAKWPLDLDYDIKAQKITALEPLFKSINKPELTDIEKQITQRKILHEATHIFGIGIDLENEENNDDVSLELSKKLFHTLKNRFRLCGFKGTLEMRLKDCELLNKYDNNPFKIEPPLGPIVSYYSIDGTAQVHDSRPQFGYLTMIASLKNPADPVDYCAKTPTMGNTFTWAPATVEQIAQIDPENHFVFHTILLPNQQARVIKAHTWRGTTIEVKNVSAVTPVGNYTVLCVGTSK